jgi:hypothetical protein
MIKFCTYVFHYLISIVFYVQITKKENFKPFTFYNSKKRVKYFIELPRNTITKTKTTINDDDLESVLNSFYSIDIIKYENNILSINEEFICTQLNISLINNIKYADFMPQTKIVVL